MDRDAGAVAIVFALSLLVLIGFVGLAVDVGSAYAKTQEVQNAADAAALAIAQDCAEADPACVDGDHRDTADTLAAANIRSGYDPETEDDFPKVSVPPSPGNRVTVEVTAYNENFFVGLFGFETFKVVRQATAQWDSPRSGPPMLPLTISVCSFMEQAAADESGDPIIPQVVDLWLPMPSQPLKNGDCSWHDTYPGGGFGWLAHDSDTCETDSVTVDDPPALGAESDPGNNVPSCVKTEVKRAIAEGDTFLVPIFDRTNDASGANAEYYISRFAALEVLGMEFHTGSPPYLGEKCAPFDRKGPNGENNFYSKTCLRARFVSWVELGGDYTGGAPDTEVEIIHLVDPDHEDSTS